MRKLPIAIFIALVLMLGSMLLRQQVDAPTQTEDKPLPVLKLTSLQGKSWDQNAIQGQVTLINFFASWCSPCEKEMPEIGALKKQFVNLRIQGIAWNDDPLTLRKWLKKNGNPYENVWVDPKGNATISMGIRGLPETFIVDHTGTIRYRHAGPITKEMRDGELGALIMQLHKDEQLQSEVNHGM